MSQIELNYDEFVEVNEVELNCIFAENGQILELDFDYDEESEYLWSHKDKYIMQYGNLIWEREVERLQ